MHTFGRVAELLDYVKITKALAPEEFASWQIDTWAD